MAYIPGGAAAQMWMEAEADELHRLRSTALFAVADKPHSGNSITAPLVSHAMERELRLPASSFEVAPSSCPLADFLVSFRRRSDRDAALDHGSFPVRGVLFKLQPWVPPGPPGRHRVGWRFYCRLALEPLPLRAWRWDVVADMLGVTCDLELDRIERQSLTRNNTEVLYAWVWTWSPDTIPRSSQLNLGDQSSREGSVTTVLIHLDQALDYTPPATSYTLLRVTKVEII